MEIPVYLEDEFVKKCYAHRWEHSGCTKMVVQVLNSDSGLTEIHLSKEELKNMLVKLEEVSN